MKKYLFTLTLLIFLILSISGIGYSQPNTTLANGWLAGVTTPSSCSSGNSPTYYNYRLFVLYDCVNNVYVARGAGSGGGAGVLTVVAFTATPTFTCSANGVPQTFQITLTGNVTSSTLASCASGQPVSFIIYQDGTGGRTFVYPTNVPNAPFVLPNANGYTYFSGVFDGANDIPLPASTNLTYGSCTEATAPATPSSTHINSWCDSTAHRQQSKNSSGTVFGQVTDIAAVTGKFVNSIVNGVPTLAFGTVASGVAVLGTSAIGSGACATVVTVTATGTVTTDVVSSSFNGDVTGVTGYVPATSGILTIFSYPSVDNVNFKVCNLTSGSITPGAVTLNWKVAR